MNDDVNNPKHYNQNGIEVIDVIETYAKSDFRLANVLKYVCRCEYKSNKLEDLKKAQWYLARVIAEMEAEEAELESNVYVKPSADRIAGADAAAKRVKAEYYKFDPTEVIATCRNPACREGIKAVDVAVIRDEKWFCSSVCEVMTR